MRILESGGDSNFSYISIKLLANFLAITRTSKKLLDSTSTAFQFMYDKIIDYQKNVGEITQLIGSYLSERNFSIAPP